MASFNKYNLFLKNQMNGGGGTAAKVIDFDTDTIKIMLTTSSYVPNAATHGTKADVTNEVSGSNYTAGGATITSPTLTEGSGTVTFDGADVTWTQHASGFTNARYAILYKSTGTDSTSPLIGYYDLATDQTNVGADYSIIFSSLGIVTWS